MSNIKLTTVQKEVIHKMLISLSNTHADSCYGVQIKEFIVHKHESLYYISTMRVDGTWTFPIVTRYGKTFVLPESKVSALTVKNLEHKKVLHSTETITGNHYVLVKHYLMDSFIPEQFKTVNDKQFFNKYFSKALNTTLK